MSVDLEALQQAHLDHHGPSRICAGPETCSAIGYLGIIENLAIASDQRFKALLHIRALDNVRTLSLYKAEARRIVAAALAATEAAPAPAEDETA